jgi:hypothetical protein
MTTKEQLRKLREDNEILTARVLVLTFRLEFIKSICENGVGGEDMPPITEDYVGNTYEEAKP